MEAFFYCSLSSPFPFFLVYSMSTIRTRLLTVKPFSFASRFNASCVSSGNHIAALTVFSFARGDTSEPTFHIYCSIIIVYCYDTVNRFSIFLWKTKRFKWVSEIQNLFPLSWGHNAQRMYKSVVACRWKTIGFELKIQNRCKDSSLWLLILKNKYGIINIGQA